VGDIGLRLALVIELADRTCGGREGQRAPGKSQRLFRRGIRRQAMLLGDNRRIHRIAARAGCSGLLTRWRSGGLLSRLRRILGTRAGHHAERDKREGEARMARGGETDGHLCSSPASRNPPKRPHSPYQPGFPGSKRVLAQNCDSLALFASAQTCLAFYSSSAPDPVTSSGGG